MDLQHPFSSESCRSSMVDHDEEMTLESPRKRQEVQELMKETEWKEARGRRSMEAGARRGNGDAGDRSRCDGVEGIYVGFKGERGQVKNHRSQSDMRGEEGEEIKSPKRNTIRVESRIT